MNIFKKNEGPKKASIDVVICKNIFLIKDMIVIPSSTLFSFCGDNSPTPA